MTRIKQSPRPLRYRPILDLLQDDQVYAPASIARLARDNGLLRRRPDNEKADYRRVRVALALVAKRHAFPPAGDDWVSLEGNAPIPGWYGWRWKAAKK